MPYCSYNVLDYLLKNKSDTQYCIVPGFVTIQVRVFHSCDTLVNRNAAAQHKYHQRHNERPEIQLFAIAKGSVHVWLAGAGFYAPY